MINIKRGDFVKVNGQNDNFFKRKLNDISISFDYLSKVNFAIDLKGFKKIMGISAIAGALIGILLGNPLLSIVLAICIPLLEIEILFLKEKEIRSIVEDSMIKGANVITNSYLHTYDVKEAIVGNIKRLESPLKELFEKFESETDIYHFSVEEALKRLSLKLKSKTLEEFTEQLIQCHRDRSNVNALIATREQFNDRAKFLKDWNNVKKEMLNIILTGILGVNVTLGLVVFYFKDITTMFMKSNISIYAIAAYILALFIVLILALKDINKEF